MLSYFVFIHVYAQHFHHHLPLFSSSIVHVQSSMFLDVAVLLKSFLHFGKTCILLQAFMHASCVKELMFFYTICMCVKAKRMATHKNCGILAGAHSTTRISHVACLAWVSTLFLCRILFCFVFAITPHAYNWIFMTLPGKEYINNNNNCHKTPKEPSTKFFLRPAIIEVSGYRIFNFWRCPLLRLNMRQL